MWQVSWSHPQFGTLLASCSYDRRVVVQRETAPGQWVRILGFEEHASSVNGIAWAPHEYGLQLAASSSDGRISVLTHRGESPPRCAPPPTHPHTHPHTRHGKFPFPLPRLPQTMTPGPTP